MEDVKALNDHDLLVRIDGRLEALAEEFRRAANGQGFPRCAERGETLLHLRRDLEGLRGKLREMQTRNFQIRLLLGGAVAGLIADLIKRLGNL
jgi:hypothetical protein